MQTTTIATAEYTTRSGRTSRAPSRLGTEGPEENLGKKSSKPEFTLEETDEDSSQDKEDVDHSNEEYHQKQQKQIKHIQSLFDNIEHQTQLLKDEQEVARKDTKSKHWQHNVLQYTYQLGLIPSG